MAQLIRGIHHAALKYDGPEKFREALHFYHELLGLPILRSWGKGRDAAAMLDTGNGVLELFANGQLLPHGVINHIALNATDVDLCISIVRMSGYEIIMEPMEMKFPVNPPYSARIAFCIGPGGEKVEFFSEN
ncbi:MAG: VOC family protein [Clostridia bacterium]|nr:VOC family protein [Clostridia bacterium]